MSTTLSVGDCLYKYELKSKVGGGHFGQVWLARDLAVSSDVAIKILDDSMAPFTETLREAQLGNKLNHPNVVKVHYADVVSRPAGNLVLIAMDHHPQGSILSLVNAGGFIPAPRAVSAMIDVLRGLEYLHERGLLHNDIKPSNILLGPSSRALLTDYGISCAMVNGQPALAPNAYLLHRAPETAASNAISIATDVYQAGLTLFRMVNGVKTIDEQRHKVGLTEFERLKSIGRVPEVGAYRPFVPASIKRVISRATAPNPVDRFQTALEMRRALERIGFGGYWDADSAGGLVGIVGSDRFTFEVVNTGAMSSITTFKEHLPSGRKTRVSRYCRSGLAELQLRAVQKGLMRHVVEGAI